MSDLDSVAQALGLPADLVSRSAAARAAAAGTTTEEVLGAWGGGGPVATTTPPPVEEDSTEAPAPSEPEPAPVADPIPTQPQVPVAETTDVEVASGEPPVLVGAHDNPMAIIAGAVALFVAILLLGLVGPSIPVDEPGARSSAVVLSEAGLEGRDLYGDLGCGGCHTQMVRPVIADVGIGPVTLSDTNQVLGARRFGPDLSNIGNRMSGAQMESIIRGGAGHSVANLSGDAMDQLVAYLLQSAPPGGG